MKLKSFLSVIVLTAFILSFGATATGSAAFSESVPEAVRVIDGIFEIVERTLRSKFEFRNNYADYNEICTVPETENGYVPQGFCITEDGSKYVISYYHGDKPSALAFVDAASGERIKTVSLLKANGDAFTGHAGGVAQDCGYLYICNGSKIYRISMEELNGLTDGGSVCLKNSLTADLKCSFINSDGEYLYAGEFYTYDMNGVYDTDASHHAAVSLFERSYSRCNAYKLSDLNISFDAAENNAPTPDYVLALPNRVQGFARGESGEFILSTSYGRNNDSFMLVYDDVTDGESDGCVAFGDKESPLYYLANSDKQKSLRRPPLMEGIDCSSGKVYGIFESGAEKYSDAAVVLNSICEFKY